MSLINYIEDIYDKKKHENVWKYQIKWKGSGKDNLNWEPLENIIHLVDEKTLSDFEKKWNKKNVKKKEKKRIKKVMKRNSKKVPKKIKKLAKIQRITRSIEKVTKLRNRGRPKGKIRIEKKSVCGSLKTDKPDKILDYEKEKDKIRFLVSWKATKGMIRKPPTFITKVELEKSHAKMVSEFFYNILEKFDEIKKIILIQK